MAVTDEAINKNKDMLIRGELVSGSRLPPEKELAEHLGLSRNSLREAVKALEVIRVLDVRRGDGTYVTSLEPDLLLAAVSFVVDLHDDDALLEMFVVRRVLESHATGRAAQHANVMDLAHLEAELSGVTSGTGIEALVEHDVRFRRAIAQIGGNDYLASLLDSLNIHTVRARVWRGLTQGSAVDRTLAEHQAMLDAIADGDPDLAYSASQVHIAGIVGCLRRATEGR